MKTFQHKIAGEPVSVNVVERPEDLDPFRDFVRRNLRLMGADSETTGLDIFSSDFRVRTAQFGNRTEGWVLPVERGEIFAHEARQALLGADQLIFHNAMYDLQVFGAAMDLPMELLWPKVLDTRILAHLVDPRQEKDLGVGHSLENLTKAYVDREIGESVKGLMTKVAKEYKTTKALIWKKVDLWHPEFLTYAGFDPMLAYRLAETLGPLVPKSARDHDLISYEHKVAEVCAKMERTGFLVDVKYSEALSQFLLSVEEEQKKQAADHFGLYSVGSTEQVADVLEELGVRIKGRTNTGKRQVNKSLLEDLIEGDNEEARDLAILVTEAKKARKWRTTWVDGFLNNRDADDRVHPSINPLAARTARMSISGIPAQTLPSSDWKIRRCFIPDPGQTIVSVDYKAQELRVLAALSGDRTMLKAFETGADLHQLTADAAGVPRKVGKMANFLQVYGGGPSSLAEQAGIDFPTARRVIQTFSATYPGVTKLAKRLEQEAAERGYIVTPTGRVMPVDESRGYAALNYLVQSTSRDVTCRGLLRLDAEGFSPYLRLPIHDEVLASVPIEHAEWGADRIKELMRLDFMGVNVDTDADIYGESWGAGYVSDDERSAYDLTLY